MQDLGSDIFVAGLAILPLAVTSWVFHYFVGLRSTPAVRAALTAGLAYLATVAILLLFGLRDYLLLTLVAVVPGALLTFGFWLMDFRRVWVDDGATHGVTLANDDWRVGVGRAVTVLGAIAVVLIIAWALTR